MNLLLTLLRRRLLLLGVVIAAVALFGAACGDDDDDEDAEAKRDISIVVVAHGQASDPFWSVVKNGVDAAAKDMGVSVSYQAPSTFDMVAMSQLIDAAVATNPDAMVISIPDADALARAIKGIIDAGIPLISINSGSDVFAELGALTHVGQTEYEAGFGGGRRMAAAGVRSALCVNQEIGNVALDLRCQGFEDALAAAGGKVEVLAVNLADPTDAQQRIENAIGRIDDLDGVLTLGPTGAAPALKAFDELGLFGKVQLATFDLSPEVLEAVVDGRMLFAIDQQQFLQGYLPIVFLVKFLETAGSFPGGGGVILTGPGFVTAENAAAVIDLSREGIR